MRGTYQRQAKLELLSGSGVHPGEPGKGQLGWMERSAPQAQDQFTGKLSWFEALVSGLLCLYIVA